MKKASYLIIGGGVAGTTAAEFIRMNDSSGSILIVTGEPERLYSRVLLPYYLRGKIPFERLYIRKQEQYEEKSIELIKGIRVDKVNTQVKKVLLSDKEEIGYNKLLIASGGKVNRINTPGSDLQGVTYLRTIKDVEEVGKLMSKAREGVVVGGGFIGIDYAQSFIHADIKTTCVIRDPYFWSGVVGGNSGKLINKILEKNNVDIISETEVEEFVGDGSLRMVRINNGKELPAQIAGIGIGVHMDMEYLKNSGVKTNKGVVTNEYLETETENVWAAGDTAEFRDILLTKNHLLGNWSNAAAQGKTAGSNMATGFGQSAAGDREKFITVSAYTISIFDETFTFLGDPFHDENTEIIERGSVDIGKLGRIYLRNSKIVGASLINLPGDRSPLTKLIENQVKINAREEKLADINFSLASLLSS